MVVVAGGGNDGGLGACGYWRMLAQSLVRVALRFAYHSLTVRLTLCVQIQAGCKGSVAAAPRLWVFCRAQTRWPLLVAAVAVGGWAVK